MDTSSDKYTVVDNNSLDISLDDVIEVCGGLYRCVYWEIGTLLKSELCVYVYGKSTSLWGGVPSDFRFWAQFVGSKVTPIQLTRSKRSA